MEAGGWRSGLAALIPGRPILLGQRSDVVHDVPDVLVLQLISPGPHVQLWRHAVLDRVEDLAVGRSVLPFVVGEIGRRRNQIVARPAFGVQAVAVRAVSRKRLLARGDRLRRSGHRILNLGRLRVALSHQTDARESRNGQPNEKCPHQKCTHDRPPDQQFT